jgi:hypothetical protein
MKKDDSLNRLRRVEGPGADAMIEEATRAVERLVRA